MPYTNKNSPIICCWRVYKWCWNYSRMSVCWTRTNVKLLLHQGILQQHWLKAHLCVKTSTHCDNQAKSMPVSDVGHSDDDIKDYAGTTAVNLGPVRRLGSYLLVYWVTIWLTTRQRSHHPSTIWSDSGDVFYCVYSITVWLTTTHRGWVSEQFLNGTSAQYRLYSAIQIQKWSTKYNTIRFWRCGLLCLQHNRLTDNNTQRVSWWAVS